MKPLVPDSVFSTPIDVGDIETLSIFPWIKNRE